MPQPQRNQLSSGTQTANRLHLRLRNPSYSNGTGRTPALGLPLMQQRLSPPNSQNVRNRPQPTNNEYTYNPDYRSTVNLTVAGTGDYHVQPVQRLQIGGTNNFAFNQERAPFTFANTHENIAPEQRAPFTLTNNQSLYIHTDNTENNRLKKANQALTKENESLRNKKDVYKNEAKSNQLQMQLLQLQIPKPPTLRLSGTKETASIGPKQKSTLQLSDIQTNQAQQQRPILGTSNITEFRRDEQRPVLSRDNIQQADIVPRQRPVLHIGEVQSNQIQLQRPNLEINDTTEFQRNERQPTFQRTGTTQMTIGPTRPVLQMSNSQVNQTQQRSNNFSLSGTNTEQITPERRAPTLQINNSMGFQRNEEHHTLSMNNQPQMTIEPTRPVLQRTNTTHADVAPRQRPVFGIQTNENLDIGSVQKSKQKSKLSLSEVGGIHRGFQPPILGTSAPQMHETQPSPQMVNSEIQTKAPSLRLRLNPAQTVSSITPKPQAIFSLNSTHEDIAPNKPKLKLRVTTRLTYDNPLNESELNSYKAQAKQDKQTIAKQKNTIKMLQKDNESVREISENQEQAHNAEIQLLKLRLTPKPPTLRFSKTQTTASIPPKPQPDYKQTIAQQKNTIEELERNNTDLKAKKSIAEGKAKFNELKLISLRLQSTLSKEYSEVKQKSKAPSPMVSYSSIATNTNPIKKKSVGKTPVLKPKINKGNFELSSEPIISVEPLFEIQRINTGSNSPASKNPLMMHRSTKVDEKKRKNQIIKESFAIQPQGEGTYGLGNLPPPPVAFLVPPKSTKKGKKHA